MNLKKNTTKIRARYFYFALLPIIFGYMLFSTYNEVKNKTIDEFNTLQMVVAKQTSKGIQDYFEHYKATVASLCQVSSLIFFNDRGKEVMYIYYQTHLDHIKAITRVDERGNIVHTVPYNHNAIGVNIFHQDHFRQLVQTKKPVISDVFEAVQGYKAVAIHMPILRDKVFYGSIAILIPFNNLVKGYIENIKIKRRGEAWIISERGVELFSPFPDHTGRSIFETSKNNPSILSMAREMTKGYHGITTYHRRQHEESSEIVTRHAAYFPIQLGNTFWSIVVSAPENEVLSTMAGFQKRLYMIVTLIIVVAIFYSFHYMKTRSILEEKRIREKAEVELRESEARLRQVIDLIPHYIFAKDRTGRFILVNKAAAAAYGTTVEDLTGKRGSDFNPNAGELEHSFKEDLMVIESGKTLVIHEKKYTDLKGNVRIVQMIKIPFSPSFSRNDAVLGIVIDITELKKTEEALIRSEKRYRDVIENANSVVLLWDQNGDIIFMNPYGLNFFGFTEEEIVGKNVVGTIVPETESTTQRDLVAMIKDIQKNPDHYKSNENENIKKNGDRVWISWTNRAIFNNNGDITEILSIGNDITEKKGFESKLRQIQRMEAIGTLAGGIAHDFNNLLMGIQGRVSLLKLDSDPAGPQFEHMEGIEEYVKSASGLTQQLLGFAREGKYEVKPTQLNELAQKCSQMFGRTAKEIIIQSMLKNDLWTVEVDRGQIEQVLMNLLVNGWQSMPEGGDMFLETDNVILDDTFTKPHGVDPGRYVKFSLTDTGHGMEKEIQEKIFDPFFTTKEKGRGTGLGLASAYGIIKNHNGIISVFSEKGKGSTFTFYIPASDKNVIKEDKMITNIKKGIETILLVDDEEIILDVGKKVVQNLGYEVFIANGGPEALEIFQKNKKDISLVILDMIMPDMDGGVVFNRLKEINPKIKVLLSSGYSIDGKAAEIMDRGCDGFIQKPFNIVELSQKLRTILDKP